MPLPRIKNPLAHLSPEEVIADVERFSSTYNLTDATPMLIKGALIARDPPAFNGVPGLSATETEAIRNEVLHKWRQPKALYLTIALCSIGAATQ